MTQGRWAGEVQLLHNESGAVLSVWLEAFRLDDGQTGHLLHTAMIARPISEQKDPVQAVYASAERLFRTLAPAQRVQRRRACWPAAASRCDVAQGTLQVKS